MAERERVSLTRLMLLWTAGVALCAVSLGEQVFLVPVTLLVSTAVCIGLLCARTDIQVWWVYGAVLAVPFVGVGLVPLWTSAGRHLDASWGQGLVVVYGTFASAAALVRWQHRWSYAGFLGVHVVVTALLLRNVTVVSDVQSLMDGAAAALLRGVDPYGITVPGVYGPALDWYYGPGALVDGRIMYGYPYLPLPLLVVLPAYLVGDIRIALVLALVATSVLVRQLATDRLGRVASVLVLTMPVSWAMNLSYWVEPILLLAVGLASLTMARGRPSVAIWFGLFLASKQYTVVHLPYLWMLVKRGGRRAALVALAVPLVLCGGFLLWNPSAFWHSAVEIQFGGPYRYDTVTLTPALERVLGSSPELLFGPYGLVLGAAVSTLLAWRCKASATALSAGIGLSLAVAVLFSRQGHTNYWGLIGGALLIAVATGVESPRRSTDRWHTPTGDTVDNIGAAGN